MEATGSSSAERRANSKERKMILCMPNDKRLAPKRNRLDVPTKAAEVLRKSALPTEISGPVAAWMIDWRLSMCMRDGGGAGDVEPFCAVSLPLLSKRPWIIPFNPFQVSTMPPVMSCDRIILEKPPWITVPTSCRARRCWPDTLGVEVAEERLPVEQRASRRSATTRDLCAFASSDEAWVYSLWYCLSSSSARTKMPSSESDASWSAGTGASDVSVFSTIWMR
mmetsp:Transcript_2740/g.8204  ORF Transcript_2740/g.8204 Transcript_2740/m.8204 type:complete len:223 (-) Transcript_2740:1658-2326(-)